MTELTDSGGNPWYSQAFILQFLFAYFFLTRQDLLRFNLVTFLFSRTFWNFQKLPVLVTLKKEIQVNILSTQYC